MQEVFQRKGLLWGKVADEFHTRQEAEEFMDEFEKKHGRATIGSEWHCRQCKRSHFGVYASLPWWHFPRFWAYWLLRLFAGPEKV